MILLICRPTTSVPSKSFVGRRARCLDRTRLPAWCRCSRAGATNHLKVNIQLKEEITGHSRNPAVCEAHGKSSTGQIHSAGWTRTILNQIMTIEMPVTLGISDSLPIHNKQFGERFSTFLRGQVLPVSTHPALDHLARPTMRLTRSALPA